MDESIALLREELAAHPDGELAGAATAFLALALASRGDALEATQLTLLALVPQLPRYQRSVTAYAKALTG
jgi:hypothetical protein